MEARANVVGKGSGNMNNNKMERMNEKSETEKRL